MGEAARGRRWGKTSRVGTADFAGAGLNGGTGAAMLAFLHSCPRVLRPKANLVRAAYRGPGICTGQRLSPAVAHSLFLAVRICGGGLTDSGTRRTLLQPTCWNAGPAVGSGVGRVVAPLPRKSPALRNEARRACEGIASAGDAPWTRRSPAVRGGASQARGVVRRYHPSSYQVACVDSVKDPMRHTSRDPHRPGRVAHRPLFLLLLVRAVAWGGLQCRLGAVGHGGTNPPQQPERRPMVTCVLIGGSSRPRPPPRGSRDP
mmetsp:Transcript_5511/g.11891  ORF Transcript_5511/g.11891 Transcript_5511/m.11891 type:complete len:260 (-) Transcript_5511:118-897(-)